MTLPELMDVAGAAGIPEATVREVLGPLAEPPPATVIHVLVGPTRWVVEERIEGGLDEERATRVRSAVESLGRPGLRWALTRVGRTMMWVPKADADRSEAVVVRPVEGATVIRAWCDLSPEVTRYYRVFLPVVVGVGMAPLMPVAGLFVDLDVVFLPVLAVLSVLAFFGVRVAYGRQARSRLAFLQEVVREIVRAHRGQP